MNYLKQNHLSILIIVFLVASSVFGGAGVPTLGALDRTTVSNPWTFLGAVTNSSTLTQTGVATFAADAVFNGGDGGVVITSSNTATSSITVGCFESYATSTATTLKLMFTASTTAPTNGSGIIPVVSYGTCP